MSKAKKPVPRARLISIHWCCPTELPPRTIRCSAPDPQPIRSRSPAAKANIKNPARSRPPKPKNEPPKTPDTVRPPVAHPPLADGSNASGHAFHRRDYGRFAGRLPRARGNPSAAGHHDLDSGRHPVCKPDLHEAAAISAHNVPPGTVPGFVIREVALCPDVCPAARGLGHVVCRQLSHRDVRAGASATDSPDQSDALCGLAPVAHDPGVSAVRHVPCPPQRGVVPHAN